MSVISPQQSSDQSPISDNLTQHINLSEKEDGGISRITKIMEAQADRVQDGIFSQLGLLYNAEPPARYQQQSRGRSNRPPLSTAQSWTATMSSLQYTASCAPECRCSCHKNLRSATPATLDRMLGRLSFIYAGLQLLSLKCGSLHCKKAQIPHVSLGYWFPMWFSKMIR